MSPEARDVLTDSIVSHCTKLYKIVLNTRKGENLAKSVLIFTELMINNDGHSISVVPTDQG